MSVDFKWMSKGGFLLDGGGDLAFTGSPMECAISMVRSRLQAALDGWKQYRIGAGLDDYRGSTSDSSTEQSIQKSVIAALSNRYLPSSAFTVSTIRLGGEIQVYVYLNGQLIAQATVITTPTPSVV